jgi:hypothetical protein
MKKFILTGVVLLFFINPSIRAQCTASLNGYISNMQQVTFEDIRGNWVSDNLFHNRLNFKTYFGNSVNFTLEVRNRFMYGETVKYTPDYEEMMGKDPGWVDLTWNLAADSSFILNSSIDRVYLDLTLGKLQITVGRQRINWGMNYVWNPNDIFNTYSFFDFDYIERPGSDAVRLQYYMGSATSIELAGKVNYKEEYSLASLIRFNLAGYDFQFLGGILNEDEYVFGTGFSGYIGPLSLNGELTFLDPIEESDPRKSALIGGFGFGYNTPFNLFLQVEYLYNQAAESIKISDFSDFYYREMSLRDLSIAPHTLFVNAAYPITPIVNVGVGAMMFPNFKGIFLGPSIDLSLRSDLDLSFFIQYFQGEFQKHLTQDVSLGFLRIKWSF